MVDYFIFCFVDSCMLVFIVCYLVFEWVDGQLLVFVLGQFLQVYFYYVDGMVIKCSYLVVMVGDGCLLVQWIEIVVSYVEGGVVMVLLGGLEYGGMVEVSGFYGCFCLQDGDVLLCYLLMVIGIGVIFYWVMLLQLVELFVVGDCEVVLLYGVCKEVELFYDEEFIVFVQVYLGFIYFSCFSCEVCDVGWEIDCMGYVQVVLLELVFVVDCDIVYLCGNFNMVDVVFVVFKEFGLLVLQICCEKYIFLC